MGILGVFLNIVLWYVVMVPVSFVVITYFEDFFNEHEAQNVLTCSLFWPIMLVIALGEISEKLITKAHEKLPRRKK